MSITEDSSGLLSGVMGKKFQNKIDEETGKDSCCPSLSLKQRVIGYGICTTVGNFHT